MGVQSVIFEIIHESLMNKDTELSVSALCEIAGVSRSGYYRWVSAEDSRNRREQQDRADFELILTAYNFRGYKKGVLGINMRLLHMGIVMNPKKIRRLMRKYNLFCPFRKANPYRRMVTQHPSGLKSSRIRKTRTSSIQSLCLLPSRKVICRVRSISSDAS